jgi:hypothetical protein
VRGDERLTFNAQAEVHPTTEQVQRIQRLQHPLMIAQPSTTQPALPLTLQKAPAQTP